MKKQTIKKLFAFILLLSGMFSFTFVNAQTCSGNKIRVYRCNNGNCQSKCVNPNNIPSGWNTVGCGTGCWGNGCNCNVRPIPFGCGSICGWRISSSDNDSPFTTSIVPNPVSNSATITFFLSQSEKISLKVYDMNGRLISTLADKVFEEGENELVWSVADVNAGVYFLQFQSAETLQTDKLIVTK